MFINSSKRVEDSFKILPCMENDNIKYLGEHFHESTVIRRLSNIVKIISSNAHKKLILVSGKHFFFTV